MLSLPNLFPRPLNPDVNPITTCFVTTTCKPGLLRSKHLCVHPEAGVRKGNASHGGAVHTVFPRRKERGLGSPWLKVSGSRFWLAGGLQGERQWVCAWRGARGLLLVGTARDGVSTYPCADCLRGRDASPEEGSRPRHAAAHANRAPSARRHCALPAFPQRGWE